MTNIGKPWAGVTLAVSMLTFGAAGARGQDIQGDIWQYQRDQEQTRRDYYQLNRDIAVGNVWGVQRDIANLQRDQQNLSIDRHNIRDDVRFNAVPSPSAYGTYPQPPCPQQRQSSWGGSPYPGIGSPYPGVGSPYPGVGSPYPGVGSPYPAGAVQFSVNLPW